MPRTKPGSPQPEARPSGESWWKEFLKPKDGSPAPEHGAETKKPSTWSDWRELLRDKGQGSQEGEPKSGRGLAGPTAKPKWEDLLPRPKAGPEQPGAGPSREQWWQDFLNPKDGAPAPGEQPKAPGWSNWRELLKDKGSGPQPGQPGEGSHSQVPKWKSWFEDGPLGDRGEGRWQWPSGDPEWKKPEDGGGLPALKLPGERTWPEHGFQPEGGWQTLRERLGGKWGEEHGRPGRSPDDVPWWKPGSTSSWPDWAAKIGERQGWQREWYDNATSRWANWWHGEERHGWWTRPVPVRPRWPYQPPEQHTHYHYHYHDYGGCWPGYGWFRPYWHPWRPWRYSDIYFSFWYWDYPGYYCYYGPHFYYPWWYHDGFTIVINLTDYDCDDDYYYEPVYYEADYATVHYEQEYGYDDDYPYYPAGTSPALGDALRDIALSWLAEDRELLGRHLATSRPVEARDDERGYDRVFDSAELLDLVTVAMQNIETERFYFTDVDESEIDQAWAEARHLYREDGRDKEAYVHYHLAREYGEWYVDAIMVKSEHG